MPLALKKNQQQKNCRNRYTLAYTRYGAPYWPKSHNKYSMRSLKTCLWAVHSLQCECWMSWLVKVNPRMPVSLPTILIVSPQHRWCEQKGSRQMGAHQRLPPLSYKSAVSSEHRCLSQKQKRESERCCVNSRLEWVWRANCSPQWTPFLITEGWREPKEASPAFPTTSGFALVWSL